ncbi:hypothetical protein J4E85_002612 [Alternaria conjuncta]|uniref:uncharacterized protein n=1 Tax=Alternaria conjuncta TaxID=181017 RepID=UPI00221F6AFF|nr:uncharacterized protein J4E85_002612 [Alternaria conjuncta]KAI4934754.1 hypothetical protein J4E85_002612 [Alternaria conjuncta]
MSSTEPDNTNTDGEQDADTTNFPVFGPPSADDLKDQLDAQISGKRQQNLVFVAELAKIEQDHQAALANNAGPSTLRQHEEAKQAHKALHSQFLRESIELLQQRLDMEKEELAHSKEENQMKEERARVEKHKKWWRSLTVEEKKRIIEGYKRESSVLEKEKAILTARLKRIAVLRRKKAVRVVAQEALEIENEVVEARNKIEDAHIARWDGIFDWHDEALLRYRVYKMLEELGMRY